MKEGFNSNYELWFLGTEVTEDTDATASARSDLQSDRYEYKHL